ncbi:MAG: peptidase S41, partial [Bacteroidetes bacterium]
IRKEDDYVVISEPYEGFPAQKAGLKAGDKILKVDDKSLYKKTTKQVSELLKGQPGTELHLTISRYGKKEPLKITLKRNEIKLKSVPYYGIIKNNIGYLQLSRFTQGASKEVTDAVNDLVNNKKAKAIIFDLRGNPGGLLIEAVNIVNVFIKKDQEVVNTKGKITQWNKVYKTMHQAINDTIPLIVLVNRGSASASEIVSGSIQDLDRGVIIGERTFGKGLVQTTRKLSYNAKLKVTIAKYYIPSGRCIQALDYTHKNSDGSVGKIPDSLITKFSTKSGRTVYDGGGILPDIIVKPEELSNIAVNLVIKNIIFKYCNYYVSKHDSINSIDNFNFTNNDYQKFISFVDTIDFDYKSASQEELQSLIDITKKEKYYDLVSDEFKKLQEKLKRDKNKDLNTFKYEVKQLISEELVSRYYYQKGRMKEILKTDPIIDSSLTILNNKKRYNTILNIK